MDIDKTGTDHHSRPIHHIRDVRVFNGARRRNSGNSVTSHSDIAMESGITCAVHNACTVDQNIIAWHGFAFFY